MKSLLFLFLMSISAKAEQPIEAVLNVDMIQGLRDPFQMPTIIGKKKVEARADIELVQLKDIHLNGVITGPKKTRAMVTLPGGKTAFIAVGSKVGVRGGRVSRITPEAVTVIEYDTDENGKQVSEEFEIQIGGDVVSLSDKGE